MDEKLVETIEEIYCNGCRSKSRDCCRCVHNSYVQNFSTVKPDGLRFYTNSAYHAGCTAQADADATVIKNYTKEHPLSWQYTPSSLLSALAAARIKGE